MIYKRKTLDADIPTHPPTFIHTYIATRVLIESLPVLLDATKKRVTQRVLLSSLSAVEKSIDINIGW